MSVTEEQARGLIHGEAGGIPLSSQVSSSAFDVALEAQSHQLAQLSLPLPVHSSLAEVGAASKASSIASDKVSSDSSDGEAEDFAAALRKFQFARTVPATLDAAGLSPRKFSSKTSK